MPHPTTTTTTTERLVTGQLRTTVTRTTDGASIDVSTIPYPAYDPASGPETCLFGSLVDSTEAVTRHDDDLHRHHEAGIDRARAILAEEG